MDSLADEFLPLLAAAPEMQRPHSAPEAYSAEALETASGTSGGWAYRHETQRAAALAAIRAVEFAEEPGRLRWEWAAAPNPESFHAELQTFAE